MMGLNHPQFLRKLMVGAGEWTVAVIFFAAGLLFIFKVGTIPGSLFDTRFNLYVLEHDYRWLVHLDHSFWSAPFFYPAPNTITYSDNHLGTFLFYSAFRLFGATRETAFQFWVLTNFTLNYGVTLLVLRMYKAHPLTAIGGAYLFAFPMVMTALVALPQLLPRYMVPVAFWMADEFLKTGRIKPFAFLLAACAYQIYAGIYIGYFLVISLIPFCTVLLVQHRKQWLDLRKFIAQAGVYPVLHQSFPYLVLCVAFGLSLCPIAIPYAHTQWEIGRRSWEELVPLLPRWQSYLYAPNSIFWGTKLQFGRFLAQPWNHQLFTGALPCLAVVGFAYLVLTRKMTNPESLRGLAMLSVPLVWGLLTLSFAGFSWYRFVWAYLPGAGSIRVITRIILVLIYPLAFVFARVLTHFLNGIRTTQPAWVAGTVGLITLMLVVVDQAQRVESVPEREFTGRITALKRKIAEFMAIEGHAKAKVLFVDYKNGERYELQNIDAMLTGQELGIKVLNGYSGLSPRLFPGELCTLSGDECRGLTIWAGLHPGAVTKESLIQVGPSCALPDHNYLPAPMRGFAGFELRPTVHVWAVRREAELALPEIPGDAEAGILRFDLTTLKPRSVMISGPDGRLQTVSLLPGRPEHIEVPLSSTAKKGLMRFYTDTDGAKAGNGDARTLFFDVSNLRFEGFGG
ncbi:MAG TPA: hypothetical protein VGD78_21720 [Chthoniobacterales bacterium]